MADLGSALLSIPAATDATQGITRALQLKDLMSDEQMKQLSLNQAEQQASDSAQIKSAAKGLDLTKPTDMATYTQRVSQLGHPDVAISLLSDYQKLQSGQTAADEAKVKLQSAQIDLQNQFLGQVGTGASALLQTMDSSKDPAQGFAMARAQLPGIVQSALQGLPQGQPWADNVRKQLVGFLSNAKIQNDPQAFRSALVNEIAMTQQGQAQLSKQQADALAKRREAAQEGRDKAYEQGLKTGKLVPVEQPDGSVTYIPASQAAGQKVGKAGAGTTGMTPEGRDILSEAVLEGVSLPTGGSRSAPIVASIFNNLAKQHPDLSAQEIVAKIKGGEINMKGLTAETSAVGRRQAGIETSAEEARNVIPIALKASADIPRGQFVPLNKIIQAGQVATSNPKLAAFAQANLTLANVYARAMSPTGTPTVEGREEALKKLSQATSPEAYKAVVDVIVQEINAARGAPAAIASDIQARTTGGPGAGQQTPLTTGTPPAAGAQPQQPAASAGGAPQRIASDADYNSLPSGTVFVGPDGKTRRKP